MKRALILLFLILIAVLGSVLTRFNIVPVNFHYYFGSIELSLALLLMLVFACGALLGLLLTLGLVLSTRLEKRRLYRSLQLCEKEIRNLREIPIKGRH
jgi:uncharacterized membrane protein YciS (DUF1049 family)